MPPRHARHVTAALLLAASAAGAADPQAARATAHAVCAACHGANGVSVAGHIPNLAGQKAAYLEAQLTAFQDGSRASAVMRPIATRLAAADIAGLAAHFAGLPGAVPGATSAALPHLVRTGVRFPAAGLAGYTHYQTLDVPETRRVQRYHANAVAVRAARDGQPLPDGAMLIVAVHAARLDADGRPIVGADGRFEAGQLISYSAMGRETGWGRDVPELVRNGDWNYALLDAEGHVRPGINQAECLACHKAQEQSGFVFTLEPLTAAAKARAAR
jgi:cytochrome c553